MSGTVVGIVLAGGAGRRLGGRLKPAIPVGGARMIDRVLAALAGSVPSGDVSVGSVAINASIIVVGPSELALPGIVGVAHPSLIIRVQESPPGGGPVAGLGAAFATPEVAASDIVVIVGGDQPVLTNADVTRLVDAIDDDGAVYVDDDGRAQWLCGAWRTAALSERLDAYATDHNGLVNGSLRSLFGPMRYAEVSPQTEDSGLPPFFDCDTEDDIRRVEEWLR